MAKVTGSNPVEPTRLPIAGCSPPYLYLGRSSSQRGMADVVSVRDLTKSYGDVRAVDGISFSVGKGEVFGIVGPNGAGKTTTWEILEGLRHADKGEVRVAGLDLRKDRRKLRELIGVQLQATALFERLTSRETLEVFGAMYARSLPADDLLTLVNLEEKADEWTEKLSGGKKQSASAIGSASWTTERSSPSMSPPSSSGTSGSATRSSSTRTEIRRHSARYPESRRSTSRTAASPCTRASSRRR